MGSSQKPFSRTVRNMGHGYPGIQMPADLAEEFEIEPGDEVPIDFDRETGRFSIILD